MPDDEVITPSTDHKATENLKNKALGQDGASVEHLFYAPTVSGDALSSQFDAMLKHF